MGAVKGTILVTGTNGGLGSAIAQQVASKPGTSAYHGLHTVRDLTRADALTSLNATHPHDILALDLTKLDNVRQVADEINTRVSVGSLSPIRALILNAGFQDFGKQSWTDDGLDTVFAANYLGHWLLTLLLLKSISQSHDPNDPRNARTGAFDDAKYESFESGVPPSRTYRTWRGGFRRYGASKLFLVMLQHELQTRLDADPALNKVCVLGERLAPWFIRVLLFKIIYPLIQYWNPNGPVRPTSRSAGDVLEAAFAVGEGGNPPKDKYVDGRTPLETSEESHDAAKRDVVWKETVRLAGLKDGETILTNWR
ncbi:putative short-chain dehydrogenase [Hypoxylon sp. FL1150]|nr:putative short-chain dehydrogenase [Hypoxylon sp. FL1150]